MFSECDCFPFGFALLCRSSRKPPGALVGWWLQDPLAFFREHISDKKTVSPWVKQHFGRDTRGGFSFQMAYYFLGHLIINHLMGVNFETIVLSNFDSEDKIEGNGLST